MQQKRCDHCRKLFEYEGRGKVRHCSFRCRFLHKIAKTDTCWIWTGGYSRNPRGKRYGKFQIEDKCLLAHRVSYELFRGPIPKDKIVCHKCDEESCVNPDHLFLGTYKDNMDDMRRKGRERMLRGPENPASRLTYEDIDMMREMRILGVMVQDIAKTFNISRQSVTNALRGRTYKAA